MPGAWLQNSDGWKAHFQTWEKHTNEVQYMRELSWRIQTSSRSKHIDNIPGIRYRDSQQIFRIAYVNLLTLSLLMSGISAVHFLLVLEWHHKDWTSSQLPQSHQLISFHVSVCVSACSTPSKCDGIQKSIPRNRGTGLFQLAKGNF
jgi:hypothetical protein